MFKHILIPVDGSPTAQKAVEKAAGLAQAFGCRVSAVYVIDPYPFTGLGGDFAYGQAEYLMAAETEAREVVTAAQAALAAAGVEARTEVVQAHAIWRGIIDAAQAHGADLIVMGSHGRRGLEKLVLGSVAQRVLTHSPLPVLIVRD
ncbi:universal stress protein UspA [Hylemonella gracilis str. Niagara R]|uniref:Universal stress protein n=1 Tax=Hylemonella gracilis str. Niagara R TaxID=1458275 RepID=A0A016XLQ7_9BURK|nr:universal stress protein [Hylemonella gracilis]EYC52123.1 universal stress protein UspA [Hylemonella gracilis str. Niagara R]